MQTEKPMVHVVGLGPGDPGGLPVGTWRLLQLGKPVILRTAKHPVVADLQAAGIAFESFDSLYETADQFDELYETMAKQLVERAQACGEIVYAVPGHPLMAEQSVQNLLRYRDTVEVVTGPGQSFFDPVCTALGIDPIDGLLLLDGTSLRADQLQVRCHTLIAQVFDRAVASDVKLTLMEVYPDEMEVTVVRAAGVPGFERIERIPLYELDRLDWIDHLTTVYVPPAADEATLRKDPWTVIEVVRRLRGPDGCPWDRQQTHASLRPFVIEEAYEVADAIDADNPDRLAAELGDLLLQVLLHAQIAEEFGEFSIRDVWRLLADKLIRRHPHVFGEVKARSAQEVEKIWQSVKAAERGQSSEADSLFAGVRWGRPAAQVALDLQTRAARIGFDWEEVGGVFAKVEEEWDELRREWQAASGEGEPGARVREEFADLLFSIVNLARWLKIDMEAALTQANRKFVSRLRQMEQAAAKTGRSLQDLSPAELEALWSTTKNVHSAAE